MPDRSTVCKQPPPTQMRDARYEIPRPLSLRLRLRLHRHRRRHRHRSTARPLLVACRWSPASPPTHVGAQPLRIGHHSFGAVGTAATRPLPDALPSGAPLDNVGSGRRGIRPDQRSFDEPFPQRAPRGCPLRQCWDSKVRTTPAAEFPTLSKTAPRRSVKPGTPARGAVSGLPLAPSI